MSLPISLWSKAWFWIKKKWEWIVGLLVGLVTLLTFLAKSRQQKKVLEAANKAHEKEKEINKKAEKDLVEGLSTISEAKDEEVKKIIRESDEEKKDLEEEKREFVDESTDSDDLGRKIAEHLGADYVDPDDK